MHRLLPFALFLELLAHIGASPVADAAYDPAHPTITQRAELFQREAALSFVGWYHTTDSSGNTLVASSEKPGSVATFRDSTLVDWCSDNEGYLSTICPDAYWTSCSGATLYSQGGSSSCISTCDYDIIYTASTADSNSLRWYHCMERPYLYFFREQPTGTLAVDVSTTESSSSETFSSESSLSDSSSTKSTTSTASPASSGTTTVASQTSEPTHSSTLAPEPPKEKEASKAWIAGVVIGIAGLLAVAGMGFYLWRQRQQHAYGLAPQGPQITMQPGNTAQQTAYYPPQQVPYGSGASPNMQPVSPNISAYDAQTYYGQSPKPQEGMMYGGHDAYAENGAPPLGVGTLQMPQGAAQAQPHMAANMHELPELAPSSRR